MSLIKKLLGFFSRKPRCRNCKAVGIWFYEDGGHDWCESCDVCGARYGVQGPPFDLVERLSNR